MNKIIDILRKNDKVQNHLALYFLFKYGQENLKNENQISGIKELIKQRNSGKHPIFGTEYEIQALDIATEMSSLSLDDLCKFIYQDVREQKKQERNR